MKNFKKIIVAILLSSLLFISCDNVDAPEPTTTSATSNYVKGNAVDRNFSGMVLNALGNPVAGATVQVGTATTQTNAKGLFSVVNASVFEKFAYLTVTKVGFINGSRVLVPTSGDNRVNIMLIPDVPTATISTGAPSQVSLPNGTTVKFSGGFKDVNGNAYNGTVQVGLYHLKPSDAYLSELMPGSLLASNATGDAKTLETFGMLHVELKGSSGQKLNLATGTTAEISLDIDSSQLASSPQTIPLWSFDETTGMWKEEGSATKLGNKYVGTVSHFSWWNCDAPFAQCNLTVTVHNSVNVPISSIKVTIALATTLYHPSGTTNTAGVVTGIVPANQPLVVKISDLCGNVVHTANVGPFTTGSSNSLPIINLANGAISTIMVTGSLKTCSNANVTNGIVRLRNPNVLNYFGQLTQTISNGSFSFTTNICGTSQQFEIIGEDYANLQTTQPIIFTATAPTTTIGTINACTAVTEFINYQIDSTPVNYILSGINAGIGNAATPNGLFVMTPQNTPFLRLSTSSNILGTFTTPNFQAVFNTANGAIVDVPNNISNTVRLVISQIGPVGGYIDFTINGTYSDPSGMHTISGTGHVIRDN